MDCASSFSLASHDEPVEEVRASGADAQPLPTAARKRRHSHFALPRRKSIVNQILEGEESILLKVDLFLTELERRLGYLESYGDLNLDSSISLAYSTLQAVRTRCSQVSEDVFGAGRRRVHVMVETLESSYQGALAAAESMNEKARVGVELLDNMLSDFEDKASKMRARGLANAVDAAGLIMDESRRVVDEGIEGARKVVDEGISRAIHAAESLEEHVQRAVARAREHGLIAYEDLPIPWRINPHIVKGYRFTESKIGCVRSAFGIHNELVNIWSHALGFVIVLAVAFYFYPTSINFSLSTKTDIFIAAVFFFAACQCLVCSTIWHTMNAVADVGLISTFACVDYTGISLLIAASIMTTEYTAFYCEPVSRCIYMTTTALLGVGGVILPWHPRFNGPDMAWARVAFFVGLGATGFLPIFQISVSRGFASVWQFYSPILKSIFVYFAGALVYASKVPERWCPGMFDYVGGSHNLWHIAVLGGILFHYSAMQAFFAEAFRRAQDGCWL
ncbi:Progestin/adipoQ receptor family protein [Coniochaeta hoffmannii]|uniref:Progestin/adipoQ receptor family protein n=1 Tax=Coniochaeta hoffmannii TaxID=91930 RepID=A0AA38SA68_9PEZI|nr:Progestin/adipoQ receptor family protein [Coniochaeta hoffmannii]